MFRVYYLDQQIVNGSIQVVGMDYIHDAILDFEGDTGILLQNTTQAEHTGLVLVAQSWREATPDEIAKYWAAQDLPDAPPIIFEPLNPTQGVEHRLTHVEQFLSDRYPSP